jgi:hypothetical protein
MSSSRRPRSVWAGIRILHAVTRFFVFVLRIVIVGLAMGVAPPSLVVKPLRHDDAVVQVEEGRGALVFL